MVSRPSRGEVWWFEEPEIGRRPGLVMTRDSAIDVLTWLLVAPATRTIRQIPTEVSLDGEDGMPWPCAVTLDNVRPVRRSLLTERITSLHPGVMHRVCEAMKIAVDC
jgi:mRNA interferase MazF